MNTMRDTTSASYSMSTSFRRRFGSELLTLLAALALALTVPARAETQPSAIPFSVIGARATASYQGDALGVTATPDGARLRCSFQKLDGHVTPEGPWLESTKPGHAGRLRLSASALGRAGLFTLNPQLSTALATTGTVSVQDKLVRFERPGLTEEYSVSVDGVRQDFVIESPPLNSQPSFLNHSAGDLRVELALSGARAEAAAGGTRLRLDGSGRALTYSRLRVTDATGRELTARLEVLSPDRLAVSVADANATYPVRIDPTFSDADWVSLGSGLSGGVNALAVSGTNLYAGGGFTTAGGVPATNIAKWNGSTWSALGSGMNNAVIALAVSGTNLYAGGWFTTAGGVPASYIAKWDGSVWFALGSGTAGSPVSVYSLAVSETNLYVGGFGYIAKWDGRAWSSLGSVTPGAATALAVSGSDLYAGGGFTTVGGVSANYIAKWNGSAWSALGSGMDAGTWALVVSGTDLYAGGFFTSAGGVPAHNIAKWDGSTWSPLGSGVPGGGVAPGVLSLAVSGTDLYAGGYFRMGAGISAANIAKWNGSAWSALGSGVNSGVIALAADGADHLFVGGNFTLAGTNVSSCIAEAILAPRGPTILKPPLTQSAEAGATVHLAVSAAGEPPPAYQWYFNSTNLLSCASSDLELTNILFSQSGTYTVLAVNASGAVTSAPMTLNVIAPVAHSLVPGVTLMGQPGNPTGLDYRDNLGPTANWQTVATMTLSNAPQFYFDVSEPLPPQRFYRAWQTGTPGVMLSLDLHLVPAITLAGSIGHSVRLDYINQFGPTDAWVTLDTVTLTNASQLYFNVSALGHPERLYRLVPSP